MIKMNGQTNEQEAYIKAWAKTMINIWEEKILLLKIEDTGALRESLQSHLILNSGGNTSVITHFFNFYGIYVDRGVGKEIKKGNPGDLGFHPNREPKPWFNSKFYYFTSRLAERLAEINGVQITHIIRDVIEGTK